ncbi:MAG: sugar nucleotide-binding protein, partial [Mariprofundaceae bacterium]|nr:sugar nucleotide-binding protein [Mariprofundaceae bacterium]
MKLLITGANGQVGRELIIHAHDFQHQAIATDQHSLDITCLKSIEKSIQEHQPDMLINAAAYTAVDQAETDHDKAYQVNAEACLYLAQACKSANIPLLHISTDYVFDGTQRTPYVETDNTNPLNTYGASKAKGE